MKTKIIRNKLNVRHLDLVFMPPSPLHGFLVKCTRVITNSRSAARRRVLKLQVGNRPKVMYELCDVLGVRERLSQ